MNFTKKQKAFGATSVLVLIFFVAGIYIGYNGQPAIAKIDSVLNKEPAFASPVDFEPFWKVWNLIDEKYPGEISDQEKVWGAIQGLASSVGDPYTVFMPPSEASDFRDEIDGEFGGIGIEMGMKDGLVTVISPLKDTPAYKVGMQAGDIIIKIDNTTISNMTLDEVATLVKGQAGTKVKITVIRSGTDNPIEFDIERAIISIPILESEYLKEDDVFVISLYSFTANAPVLFQGALRDFLNTKSENLILDLRGNPGGYLDGAIDISSWFLSTNQTVLREDFGDGSSEKVYKSRGYDIFKSKDLDMVILVDEGSASASEIVAGALKENNVAVLVGQKTYGKGSVQELLPITPETSLKITVAKWLTPNGLSISEHGLTPDYTIDLTDAYLETGEDAQLLKAIELLKEDKI